MLPFSELIDYRAVCICVREDAAALARLPDALRRLPSARLRAYQAAGRAAFEACLATLDVQAASLLRVLARRAAGRADSARHQVTDDLADTAHADMAHAPPAAPWPEGASCDVPDDVDGAREGAEEADALAGVDATDAAEAADAARRRRRRPLAACSCARHRYRGDFRRRVRVREVEVGGGTSGADELHELFRSLEGL